MVSFLEGSTNLLRCAGGNKPRSRSLLRDVSELAAIANQVQLGDSSADDGEGDHRVRASGRPDHGTGDAVDDRGPSERRQAGALQHTFGNGGRATDRR